MRNPNWSLPFEQALCYYEVGDRKTYQKNQAVAWAAGDTKRIHFNFMDRVLDGMDLAKEPQISWSDLMIQRCNQLRSKYDILGLHYSGGFDSQTIVDYFIKSGNQLDEIHVSTFDYNPVLTEAFQALEHAKLLKKHIWPNLKIIRHRRDLDYINNFFSIKDDKWLTDIPSISVTLGGYTNHRQQMVNIMPSYQQLTENFKRVVIEGTEKPRLIIRDGKWCMFMPDTAAQMMTGSWCESFYCSYELPEMWLKQHYMYIDWLENQNLASIKDLDEFLHQVQSYKLGDWVNQQWNLAVGRVPVLHEVNYSLATSTKWLHEGGVKCKENQYIKSKLINETWYDHYENAMGEFMSYYYAALIDPNDPDCAEWKSLWSRVRPLRAVRLGSKRKPNLDHLEIASPVLKRAHAPKTPSGE